MKEKIIEKWKNLSSNVKLAIYIGALGVFLVIAALVL